jgi:hypothetical protein
VIKILFLGSRLGRSDYRLKVNSELTLHAALISLVSGNLHATSYVV